MTKCKGCARCTMEFASDEHNIFFAFRCSGHGNLANSYDELLAEVEASVGHSCRKYKAEAAAQKGGEV